MSRTQFHFFYYANKTNTGLIVGTKKTRNKYVWNEMYKTSNLQSPKYNVSLNVKLQKIIRSKY